MKGNLPSVLFWTAIVACFVSNPVIGVICHRIFGFGEGRVECLKLSGYSGYQFATCRSSSYLEKTSGNKHTCDIFGFTRYCYYQCMLHLYGKTSGKVYEKCRCDPTDPGPLKYPSLTTPKPTTPKPTTTEPTTPKPTTTEPTTPEPITPLPVPSSCYTPDPNTCTWYKQCLNRAFPSCDSDNKETIKFLTEFCSFNQKKLSVLSSQGKQWLEATVKCIKRKLTPLLATDQKVKNCEDIRTTVMERYNQCYREPNSTFCDLSEDNRLGLFWHLRYNSSYHNTYENGLKNIVDLIVECRDTAKDDALVQTVKAKLDKKEREANISSGAPKDLQIAELRIKAWLENPPVLPIQVDMVLRKDSWSGSSLNKQSSLAAEIVYRLASKQKWEDKNVAWFAYAVNDGENSNIRLLLNDRCRFNKTSFCQADLATILVGLSESVLNKNLYYIVYEKVIKLIGCLDSSCEEHAFNVDATNCKTENGVVTCGAADAPRSMRMLSFVCLFLLVTNFLF